MAVLSPTATEPSAVQRLFRSLIRHRSGRFGMIALLLLLLVSLGAGIFTSIDPAAVSLSDRLKAPMTSSGEHFYLLGTDALGRDVFARMVYGARISLFIAFSAVGISLVLGLSIGLMAGYYRGWLDAVLMRLTEAQLAFPFILLALTVLAALGAGLPQLILILGVGRWDVFARVVRGETVALMERQQIEACRALGLRDWSIIFRHLLPNVINTVLVIASFSLATNILTESALSFLGVGLDVSIPTWGGMLAEGRDYMHVAWWLTTLPGIAIMITVLAINSIGDWLRDALDPRAPD